MLFFIKIKLNIVNNTKKRTNPPMIGSLTLFLLNSSFRFVTEMNTRQIKDKAKKTIQNEDAIDNQGGSNE